MKSIASVLIAEETQAVATELRSAIGQHYPAWPAVTVTNGEHAMAYLRGMARALRSTQSPIIPLLFLSLTIPQVTSLQILDWVKRQSALRTLIIALLCGVGEIPDFDRLTRYGAHAVLQKPALPSQVANFLTAIENARPIARSLPAARYFYPPEGGRPETASFLALPITATLESEITAPILLPVV